MKVYQAAQYIGEQEYNIRGTFSDKQDVEQFAEDLRDLEGAIIDVDEFDVLDSVPTADMWWVIRASKGTSGQISRGRTPRRVISWSHAPHNDVPAEGDVGIRDIGGPAYEQIEVWARTKEIAEFELTSAMQRRWDYNPLEAESEGAEEKRKYAMEFMSKYGFLLGGQQ